MATASEVVLLWWGQSLVVFTLPPLVICLFPLLFPFPFLSPTLEFTAASGSAREARAWVGGFWYQSLAPLGPIIWGVGGFQGGGTSAPRDDPYFRTAIGIWALGLG